MVAEVTSAPCAAAILGTGLPVLFAMNKGCGYCHAVGGLIANAASIDTQAVMMLSTSEDPYQPPHYLCCFFLFVVILLISLTRIFLR